MKMSNKKITTSFGSKIGTMVLLLSPYFLFAQQTREQEREIRASREYLSEAQQALQKDKFAEAEADYRKAISLNPQSEVAKYNLGTAYYEKEKNAEALLRFKQSAKSATTKAEKHRAFHNLGNTFMNERKYQEAVAAYKDALRNNPDDDQTRYNLALAKDMLEKNPPPPDQNEKDQDNQDNKDQDQKDQDNQDQENQDQDNQEQNEGDKGEEKEDKQGDEEKSEPNQPKEEEGDKPQQQQQVPGQLSPQQVKSLLEAMNNEEKKVQDKINAEKAKGAKVKSDKDW